MAEILKTADFEEKVVNSSVPVLVDFYADWCGPCKMMSPIIDALSNEVGDTAKIYKVNVDAEPMLAAKFDILSIPTIIVFKGGEEVSRTLGVQNKNDLIDRIK